jgi:hypothetical protein
VVFLFEFEETAMGRVPTICGRYRVLPQPNATFTVEFFDSKQSIQTVPGFRSEASAEEWIEQHQRLESEKARSL